MKIDGIAASCDRATRLTGAIRPVASKRNFSAANDNVACAQSIGAARTDTSTFSSVGSSALPIKPPDIGSACSAAPVALAIAKDLGASPYPFAMTVALAASAAFMTPISSPVNTLVVGPGQYSFGDFVKVGVPFTIIVAIVSVLLIPIFLPLQ